MTPLRHRLSWLKHGLYNLYACYLTGEPLRIYLRRDRELFQVPLAICTNFLAFSYARTGWNCLTALLREYRFNPRLGYRDSVLYRFHQRYQPGDMFTLVEHRPGVCFRPPVGVFPWASFYLEASRTGGRPKDPRFSRVLGPSSDQLIEWEFAQTVHLYERIRRRGYRPWTHESGFLTGVLLVRRDGARRFVVIDGTHRCAILSVLGYEEIAARYAPGCYRTLHEDDVEGWYYVQRGHCSREDALAYFHAFFELDGSERARSLGLIQEAK